MRGLVIVVAITLLAGLPLGAPPAEASHWCGETLVTIDPAFVPSGSSQVFTVTFHNQGANDIQLESVEVLFEWETSPYVLGAGSLRPGGSLNYSVTSSAVPQGLHVVRITFNGTNTADPPAQVTTCTKTRPFATRDVAENLAALILNILITILVVVVLAVVVIVVLVLMAARKRKAPPRPPPTLPAPAPPEAPPEPPVP